MYKLTQLISCACPPARAGTRVGQGAPWPGRQPGYPVVLSNNFLVSASSPAPIYCDLYLVCPVILSKIFVVASSVHSVSFCGSKFFVGVTTSAVNHMANAEELPAMKRYLKLF
jgi:hypothetical protein